MDHITNDMWLAVWEGVHAEIQPRPYLSPRAQIKQLAARISQVESRIADLVNRLTASTAWIDSQHSEESARAQVMKALAQIDLPTGEARPSCQAVIGVTEQVLKAVRAVNEAKSRLRRFCSEADSPLLLVKGGSVHFKHVSALQIEVCRRPDFDYLLAYQQIPVVIGLPELVTFRDETTRRTERITKEAVLAKLSRKTSAAATRDIRRIRGLTENETHLALDGPARITTHAYVRFDGMDAGGLTVRRIRTNLPIFFRMGRGRPRISYSDDPAARTHANRKRPTVLICKDRFLETMPVRRYV